MNEVEMTEADKILHQQQVQDEIEIVEVTIDNCKEQIERANALDRLQNNKDFERIINKELFEDEPKRLVYALNHSAMQTPEMQKAILLEMQVISGLRQHFAMIYTQSDTATRTLEQNQTVHTELLGEGAE